MRAFISRLLRHTAAAVDHQGIGGEILWELDAGGEGEFQRTAGVFSEPGGELFRTDITALTVMGAALRDEDSIPVLQPIKHSGAVYGLFQIALVAGKQDGEGGQENILGCIPAHGLKGLRIRDNELWLASKGGECGR